jgi:hypothetical protein
MKFRKNNFFLVKNNFCFEPNRYYYAKSSGRYDEDFISLRIEIFGFDSCFPKTVIFGLVKVFVIFQDRNPGPDSPRLCGPFAGVSQALQVHQI